MDFNEVIVFIKVVETGSFSGAAKLLGFPRSTVSRKVSQLEDSLGIRLLQRSTRKLSLTQSGRAYYDKCSQAFSMIEQANQEVTEAQQSPSGLLRITAPLASQSGFLCDWINEYLRLNENVSAEIILSDDNVDMIDDGIDVAFRAGVLEESSLIARKLTNTKLVVCASPSYLKKSPPINSINSLKDHNGITFGGTQKKAYWRLESSAGVTVVQVKERVSVNSMEFAVQACIAGLGIALLPAAVIGQFVESKQIEIICDDFSSDVGGLYVVYPSKTHLSTTIRTFVDFIIEKSRGGIPWDRKS